MLLLQNKIYIFIVMFLILFLSYKNTFTKIEDLIYKRYITTEIKSKRLLSEINLKHLKYTKVKEYDDLKKNCKKYKEHEKAPLLYNLINKDLQKYDWDEYLYYDGNSNEKYIYYKKNFDSKKDTENIKRKIKKIFDEKASKYLIQSKKKKKFMDYIKMLFYKIFKKEKKKIYKEIKKEKKKGMSDFDIFQNSIYTIIFTMLSIGCLSISLKLCCISAITFSIITSIVFPTVFGIIGIASLMIAGLLLYEMVSIDEYELEDNYKY
ncbi:putative exported protein [Plasmodium reichenowi]|uniref:Putative exported protein n=1 Tax=Plasmodium reichenowi TaxID=5854 RepID=A0A151LIF3_PLARE|nr:putative exported protein [Plasmodium reichenowi]KYN98667.1 putative exported protein [Plasmodium reichenowi]